MTVVYSVLVIRAVTVQVYFQYQDRNIFDALLITVCALKLLADAYVMRRFLLSLGFFIRKKAELQRGVLTPYNKRVVIAILTLFAFQVVISIDNILLWTLTQLSYFQGQAQLQFVLRIFIQPVSYTMIFLTCLGCLYLFHYQGMKERKAEAPPDIKDLVVNFTEDAPQQSDSPLGEAETLSEGTVAALRDHASLGNSVFIKYLEGATQLRRPTGASSVIMGS